MTIPERTRSQIVERIADGESLDPFDLEAFYGWIESSYQALEFDPVQQGKFDEYCRSSCGYGSMRLYTGVWLLKQALYKDTPDNYAPTYSHV